MDLLWVLDIYLDMPRTVQRCGIHIQKIERMCFVWSQLHNYVSFPRPLFDEMYQSKVDVFYKEWTTYRIAHSGIINTFFMLWIKEIFTYTLQELIIRSVTFTHILLLLIYSIQTSFNWLILCRYQLCINNLVNTPSRR